MLNTHSCDINSFPQHRPWAFYFKTTTTIFQSRIFNNFLDPSCFKIFLFCPKRPNNVGLQTDWNDLAAGVELAVHRKSYYHLCHHLTPLHQLKKLSTLRRQITRIQVSLHKGWVSLQTDWNDLAVQWALNLITSVTNHHLISHIQPVCTQINIASTYYKNSDLISQDSNWNELLRLFKSHRLCLHLLPLQQPVCKHYFWDGVWLRWRWEKMLQIQGPAIIRN